MSFDIEVSIGKDDDVKTYIIHVNKQIGPSIKNPDTGDNLLVYVFLSIISFIPLIAIRVYSKKISNA